jgi:hypothetical protein
LTPKNKTIDPQFGIKCVLKNNTNFLGDLCENSQ